MKRYIYFLIIAWVASSPFVFAQYKDMEETKEIIEDIQIINLLNNLSLKKNQMEFILQKAREAKVLREETADKISAHKAEIKRTCQSIKEEVAQGKVVVDKQTADEFHAIKEGIEKLTYETNQKIDEMAASIENQLEEFQLASLDEYKPCTIPVMKQGRIGQADASLKIVKILENVKAASDQIYNREKDAFVNRTLERIKLKTPLDLKIDESAIKKKILDTFDAVRKMEPVDFQLNKESIAKELQDCILPEKKVMSTREKTTKLLLSEKIIPILEKRLRQ